VSGSYKRVFIGTAATIIHPSIQQQEKLLPTPDATCDNHTVLMTTELDTTHWHKLDRQCLLRSGMLCMQQPSSTVATIIAML
jgi:hypothetical protein